MTDILTIVLYGSLYLMAGLSVLISAMGLLIFIVYLCEHH